MIQADLNAFLIFIGFIVVYLLLMFIGYVVTGDTQKFNKHINNMQYQVSYYSRGNSLFRKEIKVTTVTGWFGLSEKAIISKAQEQLKTDPDYIRIKEVLY